MHSQYICGARTVQIRCVHVHILADHVTLNLILTFDAYSWSSNINFIIIQHKKSDKKRRAREASKVQHWYRANKKRCYRLQDHFTESPSDMSNRPLRPEGLPKSERESDDNELTYEIHPEEVKSQLKRLPTQSSPGPNGVLYFVWKSSSIAPELLSAIYTTCCINFGTCTLY